MQAIGGVQLLLGDGHVDFMSESIDGAVWLSLGSCNESLRIR